MRSSSSYNHHPVIMALAVEKFLEILETLEKKDLVMKIDAPIGTVWVDKKEYREKARGTDKL